MTSPADNSAATPPVSSPPGPAPASGVPERRPYVRLMAALGGMGAVAAVIGALVGFTTDPAFPLPEKLPTLPVRPGMPPGLPTGPGALPSGFPSGFPTELPSGFPTDFPTDMPTSFPTDFPTDFSGGLPSGIPTDGSVPKSGGTR
ncbi:hypothetical protein GPZ77_01370 [Streptomyces sp. QHH-9511]|uniref:hypothetical protein n=2 Tax=Streptomyces TaxID=1883 RepID=UPI001318861F|nr:hypothetical protein [Streptomyces sp. QHH-9511]QGZ47238.1 hypothetical protein GPZ77_01370 [Streptomyces sp. QHH-9511]